MSQTGKSLALLLKAHVHASILCELAHQFNESRIMAGDSKGVDRVIIHDTQVARGTITGMIRFPSADDYADAIKEMENDKIDRDMLAVTLDFHGCPSDLIRVASLGAR